MKNILKISLLFLTLIASHVNAGYTEEETWWASDGLSCYTDPDTGNGFRCYNDHWTDLQTLQMKMQHASSLQVESPLGYGTGSTTTLHCVQDMLYYNPQAANRNLWALKCNYTPVKEVSSNLFTLDYATLMVTINPSVFYPVFGLAADNLWSGSLPRYLNYETQACGLASGVKQMGHCEVGCFSAAQSFPFIYSDELRIDSFENAPSEEIEVFALQSGSSLNNLSTKKTLAYVVKQANTEQIHHLLTIALDGIDGTALTVTQNHPLLNDEGLFIEASMAKVGDRLMTVNGPAAITSINEVEQVDQVHNILPVSTELSDNVVVVGDGVLVGSHRVLRKEFKDKQRVFVRGQLEIDS